MIKKIKKCLKKNKVYFELIPPTLLGIASVYISLSAYNISKQQLKYTELESSPHFSINETFVKHIDKNTYDNVELSIFNHGKPSYNITTTHNEFLQIHFLGVNSPNHLNYKLDGYFTHIYETNSPKGLIATLRGNNNNALFYNSYSKIHNHYKNNDDFVHVSIRKLITVNYRDINNQVTTIYFLDDKRIDKSKAEEIQKVPNNIHLQLSSELSDQLIKLIDLHYSKKL